MTRVLLAGLTIERRRCTRAAPLPELSQPAHPRHLIPASPGDSCDTLSRLVGQKVGEHHGQQLAVDNREMNHAMSLPDVRGN